MLAMLLASVIQGQVVAVYNTEKQEACEQLGWAHETPQSTASPQTASLQGTVLILKCKKAAPLVHISLAATLHCIGIVLLAPEISCYPAIYRSFPDIVVYLSVCVLSGLVVSYYTTVLR